MILNVCVCVCDQKIHEIIHTHIRGEREGDKYK